MQETININIGSILTQSLCVYIDLHYLCQLDKALLKPQCSHPAQEREPEHTKNSDNVTGEEVTHGGAVAGPLSL